MSSSLPQSPLTADIPNAAYPTPGLGLVLGTNGLMDPTAIATGARTGLKFLRDDQTWQVPPANTTFRKLTSKQVLNTVTDTDLFNGEFTFAANDLGTNKCAKISAEGDYVNNSGAARIAQQFKLKLGATTLIDVGVPVGNSQTPSATRFGWRVTATIANLTATTQSVYFDAVVTCNDAGAPAGLNSAFATGEGTVVNLSTVANSFAQVLYSGWNSGGVDTTASLALVLSVVNSTGTATYDTTLKRALVEIV